MSLQDAFADRQSQAGAEARLVPAVEPGEPAEQVRQAFGGHALALIGHGDGHVALLRGRGHPNGSRLGRVAGGVGQQVVQDLEDALPVGHHRGQIGRQLDAQDVPAPRAQEGVAGLIHQPGQSRRFGLHRQGAGLDAGHVQQVVDQAPHVIGLLVDDAKEEAPSRPDPGRRGRPAG